MKFDARDGSSARTLAVTAAGWWRTEADRQALESGADRPVRPSGISSGGNGQSQPSRATTATYAKGQHILSPGHGNGLVFVVRSGYVRLYKTLADGRAINVGLLGPNTVFAQEERQDGIASGITAEALADTTLAIGPADDLAALIADSPELAAGIVEGMTRRLTELQTLVEQILVRDTSVRLLSTLVALARGFGRPTADGLTAIALALTHQGLANMIGSNRVTVTRKLIDLQDRGLVRSVGRNEIAIDVERARLYIRQSPPAACSRPCRGRVPQLCPARERPPSPAQERRWSRARGPRWWPVRGWWLFRSGPGRWLDLPPPRCSGSARPRWPQA